MGNLNCSRCVEEIENTFETNYKNSVIFNKAILQAYTTLQESEFTSLGATNEIDINSISPSKSSMFQILRSWRVYKSRQILKNLRNSSLSTSYFPSSDVFFTISKSFYSGSRKKQKFIYLNGAIYQGEAKGGFRDGYGKIVWPDNCYYEGNWSFGYPSGYGKFVYSDKEHYEGKWVNPFPYGKQSITSSTKSFEISPNYNDGYRKVYLVWLWFKGENSNYKGKNNEFYDRKNIEKINAKFGMVEKILNDFVRKIESIEKNLEGKKSEKNEKGEYLGEIISGKREGVGKMIWKNNNLYVGQWFNDEPCGLGKSNWIDGSSYMGNYKSSLKEGLGIYKWDNGNYYVGEWNNDVMQGTGKYHYIDGRVYLGEWNKGEMDGFGIFYFGNGKKFEGHWKMGKKHGIGCSISTEGKQTINHWENGRIID